LWPTSTSTQDARARASSSSSSNRWRHQGAATWTTAAALCSCQPEGAQKVGVVCWIHVVTWKCAVYMANRGACGACTCMVTHHW
jgi:hypothetical protein